MSIEAMSLVRFYGHIKDLDQVLLRCMDSGQFHPEQPAQMTGNVRGFAPLSEENPYRAMLAQVEEIAESAGIKPSAFLGKPEEGAEPEGNPAPRKEALILLLDFMQKTEDFSAFAERIQAINDQFEQLFACAYLKIRFGRLPADSMPKLGYFSEERFHFFSLASNHQYHWGFFITTEENAAKIEDIFAALSFQMVGKEGGFALLSGENPYESLLASLRDVAEMAELELIAQEQWNEAGAEAMDAFIHTFREQLMTLAESKKRLEEAAEQSRESLRLLERMKAMKTSFDVLFDWEYIKLRFGRLPADSYAKLDYYADKLFLFFSLSEDKRYHWGFFATTREAAAEADDIFAALYFERIWVPDTIHGAPEKAMRDIEDTLKRTETDIAELNTQISALVRQNKEYFLTAYTTLDRFNHAFDLRRYVGVYRDTFHLTGFVPKREETRFAAHFEGMGHLTLTFQPHDSDKRLQAPTKLKNNRFCEPFEMFVDMYGTPAYDEMDPTAFLAVTYTLLFGVMFGDLGQGMIIAFSGLLLWRLKGMAFGRILMRIGACSALFGLIYGSVFGLENVLDPLYGVLGFAGKPVRLMEPVSINNLLLAAVGMGAALVIASMLINVAVGVKNGDVERAVFSNNGLAGLVFYGGILAGVISLFAGGPNLFTAPYVAGVILLPILVIFFRESLKRLTDKTGGILPENTDLASFILEGFFELFEITLSFVTNTLSFLRVGGFVISHAGMMGVVLTLSEMMRGAGGLLVLIAGNAFVIALEGFIVGIQILRLEFYEMFSHYFEGQGAPYRPIGYKK